MCKMAINIITSTLLFGSATLSHATAIFYTDEASFLAAAGTPAATITYEGIAPDNSVVDVFGSYTENGITISDLAQIFDDDYNFGTYDIGTGATGQSTRNTSSTVSYAGGPLYAGGATVFTVQSDGNHSVGTVSISLSSGDNSSVATGNVNGEAFFIGFTSDTPIDSFSLTATPSTRWLQTDNIVVFDSLPSPVPLASTLWLLGLGLVGLMTSVRPAAAISRS